MASSTIYTGTFARALRSDPEDTAFGIYSLRVDLDAGTARPLGLARTTRPGWLVQHPTLPVLYAVNEAKDGSSVTAYAVDDERGLLSETARRPTTGSPCHAAVTADGRMLAVTCFHGGAVHTFALDEDGGLGDETGRTALVGSGTHPVRQAAPHPHSVNLDPSGRWALVPDFGTDRVEVFAVDADTRTLVHRPEAGVSIAPGSGARHGVFTSDGGWFFVVSEMSAAVTSLRFDPSTGAIEVAAEAPILPLTQPGLRSGAEIVIDAADAFLYATNRAHGSSGPVPEGGEDCVAWFAIDRATGALAQRGRIPSGGSIPRTCLLTADGRRLLVAHQGSSTIVVFDIADDGSLAPSGTVIETPVPVALAVRDRTV